MKFRFLLWMLGRLMAKASRENPAFQQQLVDRDMVFQLHTLDGKVARHFIVKNQRITSKRGPASEPAFALGFKDAALCEAKGRHATFPSWLPWPRIILDHVLFPKGLDASDVSSFCVEGSDHLALADTLTLK